MTKTFAERCHIAQQFLPDAQYKALLTNLHAEMLAALADQPAPAAPVQDRNPYAWHYKNTGGASVWHFGPSNKLDADLEAAKKWPRTHQVTPVFTEQRTQQDCAELEELGWQAVWCPSCGNAGAKGYPRKLTPSLNQLPCGYEHHEYRPYGAPGEVRIHAVLASQYRMPDGTVADEFQWLIDEYKADPNTIKLLPLYTTPQAQEEPATLPEGKKLILVDGSFDDLMYWLERCEEKGHLENCPDLVEPLQNFSYKAYTTPQAQPRREWVGLTDEERDRIWSSYRVSFVAIGHIESKLREKNT